MNMPVLSIVMGLLLCLVGVAGEVHYVATRTSDAPHFAPTALIPLYVGVVFMALGAASLARPTLRKHLMHALAALSLLGAVAAVVPVVIKLAEGKSLSPVSFGSQVAMGLLCAITTGLCVRSFVDARRSREAIATPTNAIDTM